eukprot:10865072-Lingulodinium_polyedra.AAC.1
MEEMLCHAKSVMEAMEESIKVETLAAKDTVDEEILGVVARHQSNVGNMVSCTTPALPPTIVQGFSKWTLLSPFRQKAVDLYERSMAQFKLPVVEVVLHVVNESDGIEEGTMDMEVDVVGMRDLELKLKRLTEYAADPMLEQKRIDFVLAVAEISSALLKEPEEVPSELLKATKCLMNDGEEAFNTYM